jgi:hypothetical protein
VLCERAYMSLIIVENANMMEDNLEETITFIEPTIEYQSQ